MNCPDTKNCVPVGSSSNNSSSEESRPDSATVQAFPDGTVSRLLEQNQDFCRVLNQQIHDLKNLLWPVTLLAHTADSASDSTQLLNLMGRIECDVDEVLKVTVRMSELLKNHSRNFAPEVVADSLPARRIPCGPATRLRILCVDDDPSVRGLLRQMLTFLGHSVMISSSGSDALQAFASNKFDVVLTEQHLMNVKGHNIADEIRAIRSVPIIWLMQSDDKTSEMIAQLADSLDGFLIKPLSLPVLRETLDRIATQ